MSKLKLYTGVENEVLRKKSVPVKQFDGRLKGLVNEMKKTMLENNGLGLAAPQVGENIRVFTAILNYKKADQVILAMVNPVITPVTDEVCTDEEGCLSLPGQYAKIERFDKVRLEFFDENGSRQILELNGLNARVVQHENDHLDGILFVDRVKGHVDAGAGAGVGADGRAGADVGVDVDGRMGVGTRPDAVTDAGEHEEYLI